jgi:hypothetical protein
MENTSLSKYSTAFGLALAVASVVNAVLVVAKEKSPAVLAGMKSLTGHHWVTHVALVVLLFLAAGFGLALANGGQGLRLAPKSVIATLVGGVAASGLIILGFYLVAD